MSRADIDSLRIYLDKLKQKYIQPLEEELEILESIAKGAQGAKSFDTYRSMISMVNGFKKDQLTVGTNILIGTLNVPDLWVFGIEEDSVPYIYSSDEVFVQDLKVDGRIRVGHFVLAALETLKVDLTDYVKNTDYANSAKAGVVLGDKTFGFQVNANGIPTCDILSASEYAGKTVACFISKGTLENAKNDIVKRAIVGNDITLTDEEKATACEWLGISGGGGTPLYMHRLTFVRRDDDLDRRVINIVTNNADTYTIYNIELLPQEYVCGAYVEDVTAVHTLSKIYAYNSLGFFAEIIKSDGSIETKSFDFVDTYDVYDEVI